VSPTIFGNFLAVHTEQTLRTVTDAFLRWSRSPPLPLVLRAEALGELGHVVPLLPADRLPPCLELCDDFLAGRILVTQATVDMLQMNQDPLAIVHIFEGDATDIQYSLAFILTRLLNRLDPVLHGPERARLLHGLREIALSGAPKSRALAAQMLGEIETGEPQELQSLAFSFVSLLNAADPSVRASAVAGVASMIRRGAAVHEEVLAAVSRLGRVDNSLPTRLALARSIELLASCGLPDAARIRTRLAVDPSFQVRWALANGAGPDEEEQPPPPGDGNVEGGDATPPAAEDGDQSAQ
jgi:hypothetical protein